MRTDNNRCFIVIFGSLTISARSGYFGFRKVSKSLRQLKTAVTKVSKSLRQLKTAVTKISKSLRQLKTAVTKSLNLFKFCRNCQRALYFEKIMINLVIKYWIIAPKGRLFTFCSPTLQSHR
jgi:hypothetical protein